MKILQTIWIVKWLALIWFLLCSSLWFKSLVFWQMIFQNPKLLKCLGKAQLLSTPLRRRRKMDGAGVCSGLESRTTGWTWRQLSPIRKLSAMEVRGTEDCYLDLQMQYQILNASKNISRDLRDTALLSFYECNSFEIKG